MDSSPEHKDRCEARYWAKQYKARKVARTKLTELVGKRSELFRETLNKELRLK